jgi:hemerythrin-like domain-containing protein
VKEPNVKPTEILSQEHRVIEVVLDCLEKMAGTAAQTQRLDESAAREAIHFFRHFADGCHHAKEENQLFPAMEARGFNRNAGPLSVMLYEHTAGREAVRGMDQAVDAHVRGEPQAVERFVDHARRFLQLLRAHIEKEDHCLFAMANQALSDGDQAELRERFAQADRAQVGAAAKEQLLESARRLAERYRVEFPAGVAGG